MKKIHLKDILDYLDREQIAYTFQQGETVREFYEIASLFAPVNGGFYFFTGKEFHFPVENSLILCGQKPGSGNSEIQVENIDIQLLYYRLLAHFFPQTSTGQIHQWVEIHPEAQIGKNVQIDAFCVIGKCEIGDDVVVGSHTKIYDGTIIGNRTVIESGSVIGTRGIAWAWNEDQSEKVLQPQLGGVKIGKGCVLSAQTVIVRGSLNENTIIGDYSFLAAGCRLGHGTVVGDYVHIANAVITGGNTKIGDYCFIGSGAVFRPKVKLDENTVVGAGSVVVKNTSRPGMTLMGVPAQETETKDELSGMPKPKK